MNYSITPFIGAGTLKFGAVRTDVSIPGVDIEYDTTGHCESIEFHDPAVVSYEGKSLIGLSQNDLEEWLSEIDPNTDIDLPDITSSDLGIAFFIENDKVATVLIFVRGYFDR